jgi:hypothetical protein
VLKAESEFTITFVSSTNRLIYLAIRPRLRHNGAHSSIDCVKRENRMTRPTCPVCAMEMAQERISLVRFPGGNTKQILKFLCQACRVEMNTAAKSVPDMEYRQSSAA